ncbi:MULTISPECIES: WecB/TagA/CpsF family glycosyltransferase [Methylotenera]|uniref:WecB/TagA/CpsF family glycosyltransferase n=1 Tax=Methylotenera TaxID=359407 RepID=UPI00036E9B02|nr:MULTISPECIES: WecB/TagA/CpsF family glycosyltransferase [Methylotenera]
MIQSSKKRVRLFGADIDPLNMQETVSLINSWIAQPQNQCHFVVTPNVDHIVKLQTDVGLQKAYKDASLVVTDGRPVVWAADLLGVKLPGTVPGSDLVPALFEHAQANHQSLTVFLLGAMPGVADRAKDIIHATWPMVKVVGTLSPDFGFEKKPVVSKAICEAVNASGADLLLLGLGAPKQELWIAQHSTELSVKVALCIGATIDFIAGEKSRAPVWMQKIGLEWLHRMLSEPRRLAKRYIIDAIIFPKLIFNEWLLRRQLPSDRQANVD